MKCLVAVCLVAGCYTDEDDEDFPIVPGSGTTATSGTAGMLRGRACMSDDLTALGECARRGVGGLSVTLGTSVAITADDGSFALVPPRGSLQSFTVSGAGAVTTTTPYAPGPFVPVINADVWASTLASNDIFLPPGTGSILGTVVRGREPAPGIMVSSTPGSAFGPFYDGETGFTLDRTGARGVFFVPGLAAGPSTLGFAPGDLTVVGISVIEGGVTILDSVPMP
jgi:hypothetical protein